MSSTKRDKGDSLGAERRSAKREMTLGAHLFLYPFTNRRLEKIEAITSDVSNSGMSIYTYKRLKVGSIFTIDSKTHPEIISKGKVIWCTKIEDTIYKVGLSLL